ncbi:phage-related hypothetical protein [Bordetella bronchiseptica RB50]|uniref:Uncharacterized protein n=1 Tax=Bordetella bronchiseptica (strain ATCC BAA-588 / NCTC 13252 / RB50) TaxID=257310 RepID=A0A0H3LPQ5_BORBR|nr:hypothetical protein [Bordetella bronchiseptica]CAE34014.1 phage-related hypothetical protein [Bordetella bronchiseptica RB50]
MLNVLRRVFVPRPIRIEAWPVHVGDDLILSVRDWPASQDMVGFLNATQQQFPGVRIHLLAGFDSVQVSGEQRRAYGKATAKECQPKLAIQQYCDEAISRGAKPGPQGNVVLLTWASAGRVVVVSVPPQVKGDAVEKFQASFPGVDQEGVGASDSTFGGDALWPANDGDVFHFAARQWLALKRPDLLAPDRYKQRVRCLAKKLRKAANAYLDRRHHPGTSDPVPAQQEVA